MCALRHETRSFITLDTQALVGSMGPALKEESWCSVWHSHSDGLKKLHTPRFWSLTKWQTHCSHEDDKFLNYFSVLVHFCRYRQSWNCQELIRNSCIHSWTPHPWSSLESWALVYQSLICLGEKSASHGPSRQKDRPVGISIEIWFKFQGHNPSLCLFLIFNLLTHFQQELKW